MSQKEFTILFNELEGILKKKYNLKKEDSISKAINMAKNDAKNNPIKNNIEVIEVIRELRNLITHQPNLKITEIADPSAELVLVLRKIVEQYSKPKRIGSYMKENNFKNIVSFSSNDNLKEVLDKVSEFQYSQFPVFDKESYIGMITDNGITNWIANSIDAESNLIENLKDVKIEKIITFEEKQNNVVKIYKEETIFSLISAFEEKEVNTVLICEKKNCIIEKPTDLMGIMTTYDLKDLYKEI